ncbi:carbohydrate kinase family protein [Phragmitibacter flavus]|uniref:Carbohydrate kinase family protein n=1 Tax=Phragmitibacter flavus TaxID=2576071 RepID=A0A5R8KC76_9BACT|nr:carbohydrate kinase family protein [Phragmitibacter flavus]TLD69898.1 carbohydrate kinase family protein [Phragmitibacter flavus]
MSEMTRNGILAVGNFIVDDVKLIDAWPEQDMLASIRSERSSNGGGPYNVLKDLAAMGAGYPLQAAGLIGGDARGEWILRDCVGAGVGVEQLHITEEAPTSYTDAMTVMATGRRTFFHQRGANALLTEKHVDFARTEAKHLHLGYLMLLDAMDEFVEEEEGRTRASILLERALEAGLTTSVDMVSTEHGRFREIALSALPFTDVLVINEVEAGKVTGRNLQGGTLDDCVEAARELMGCGVRRQVVIHLPQGAVVVDDKGSVERVKSLKLPEGFVAGATGGGDAFAAGYLHGWHEGWDVARSLQLAVCAAAACLSDPTPSAGLCSVAECLKLGELYGADV